MPPKRRQPIPDDEEEEMADVLDPKDVQRKFDRTQPRSDREDPNAEGHKPKEGALRKPHTWHRILDQIRNPLAASRSANSDVSDPKNVRGSDRKHARSRTGDPKTKSLKPTGQRSTARPSKQDAGSHKPKEGALRKPHTWHSR